MEWMTHDNAEEEDRRFAHILADALWRTQTGNCAKGGYERAL